MKTFGKIISSIVGISALSAISSSIVFYLLSDRRGNVDFLWNGEESEHNKNIRLKREADHEWLCSNELTDYYITSRDGLKLHASLLKAEKPTNKYIFAVHGYRCYGTKEFDSIAKFYHEHGINVFMIDHRASGTSEGKYITYGAKETLDCIDWLAYMLLTFGPDISIGLHGCSMGSATVMMMTGNVLPSNVKFAVADCGYSSLRDQLYHNFRQYKMPPALFYPLYRNMAITKAGFDPNSVSPISSVEKCTLPIIFAHGLNDDFVPHQMVYALYDACASSDKKLFTVDGAEHVQSFQLSDDFKNSIAEFLDKYL